VPVERCLLRAPVEARRPVRAELAQVGEVGAVGPSGAGIGSGQRVAASRRARSSRTALGTSMRYGRGAIGLAPYAPASMVNRTCPCSIMVPFSAWTSRTTPAHPGHDVVHELHHLDDADDVVGLDMGAGLHERRGPGLRGAVEDADARREHLVGGRDGGASPRLRRAPGHPRATARPARAQPPPRRARSRQGPRRRPRGRRPRGLAGPGRGRQPGARELQPGAVDLQDHLRPRPPLERVDQDREVLRPKSHAPRVPETGARRPPGRSGTLWTPTTAGAARPPREDPTCHGPGVSPRRMAA
jgi:hypothetical protein